MNFLELAVRRADNAIDSICAWPHIYRMTDTASVLAALSDRTRLGAVRLLWDGREHCVCEMMELLDASQSRMSRHLAQLKAVGLVIDRRDAQWVRYRRNPELAKPIARIVDAVLAALPNAQARAA